uniref:Protein-L-isoaspartate O-methyltransferase n=1 Tax=uncultured marine group II/III euryarchaeote KM3_99_A09 TaxID=1456549 RepID=A0A075I0F4_9EURY|nr:protein-L-isoaspartate O-methyltransferase (pcm) [uncultured marine group II/III euryarchaeote KM3_99_A09]
MRRDSDSTRDRGDIERKIESDRNRMVEEQIAKRGIKNPRVLAAMRDVPRHLFVPEMDVPNGYLDTPLPIGEGQTISQPFMVAHMSEILAEIPAGSKILEIGSGSGYQTAILVHMGFEVYSIERLKSLAMKAKMTLKQVGLSPKQMTVGDGHRGLSNDAPFAGIIVAACAKKTPQTWVDQLEDGGILVTPMKKNGGSQVLRVAIKEGGQLTTRDVESVKFVPLIDDRPKSILSKLLRR